MSTNASCVGNTREIEFETQNNGLRGVQLALEESLIYVESIVETIREPLLVLDSDLKIISANRNFYKTFKVTPVETLGRFIYDLGDKQWDIPRLRELLETILPRKATFDNYEVEHDFATIGRRIMLLNAWQIQRALGKERIILLAIEDITERKRTEEVIENNMVFQQVLMDAVPSPIFFKDAECVYIGGNKAFVRYLGLSPEQFIGKTVYDISPADLAEKYDKADRELLNNPGVQTYEASVVYADGTRHKVVFNKATFTNTEGKIAGLIGVIFDITERKKMEALRTADAEWHRAVLQTAMDGFWQVNTQGCLMEVNEAYCRMSGYSEKELLAMRISDLDAAQTADEIAARMKKIVAQGGDRFESLHRRKDGSIFDVEVSTQYQPTNGGQYSLFLRDTTDRKRAKEALLDSERRLHTLVQTIPDLIWLKDKDGVYLSCNTMFERFFGASETDIVGKTDYDFVNRELADSFREHDCQAMAAGKTTSNEEWITFADDGHRVFLDTIKTPMYDAQGTLIGVLGIGRDITDRSSVERIRKALGGTVQAIAVTVEARDPYTAGHQRRVADLARAIATEMNLSIDIIDGIRMAAAIHDLGKISVPAEILSKPTKLKKTEFDLIKDHPQSGYDILKDIDFPWPVARIVLEHHEKMNGSGYPHGLTGDNILLESRIISVADVVESMASHRPYRPSMGIEAALEEIEKNKGTFYDDAVADACLRLFREKGFQLKKT
jgi:PAS domain S-box-containing protein